MKLRELIAFPFRMISHQCAEHVECFFVECRVASVHALGRIRAGKFRGRTGLKLNLGSGGKLKDGYLNIDFHPKAELRLDLRRRIPLPDDSCEVIFSEHFLEHLEYPEEADAHVLDCRRLLAAGGTLKLSVPDTEWPLREYADPDGEYLAACEREGWHPEECTTWLEHLNYHFRQRWTGTSRMDFQCHRFAYDFETLSKLLDRHGFTEVRRRDFEQGLDGAHRSPGSLLVTATNPGPEER